MEAFVQVGRLAGWRFHISVGKGADGSKQRTLTPPTRDGLFTLLADRPDEYMKAQPGELHPGGWCKLGELVHKCVERDLAYVADETGLADFATSRLAFDLFLRNAHTIVNSAGQTGPIDVFRYQRIRGAKRR